jgi:chemotaxis protein MotB
MPTSARTSIAIVCGLACVAPAGCNLVPASSLRSSQMQAQRLYSQNQQLAGQAARAGQLEAQVNLLNQRVSNLASERATLRDRYANLLERARSQGSPLSGDLTRRFQELAERYPDFEFDPETGVSKFHADILFASGSDQLRPTAHPILQEFAAIMNDGAAQHLNILVVGHTDDQPISRQTTRNKHETNWHLSTNRANSVVTSLQQFGVQPDRMGSAGYSKFQPVVSNRDDQTRQRNRRVEIFVLAPDAIVAGCEPHLH